MILCELVNCVNLEKFESKMNTTGIRICKIKKISHVADKNSDYIANIFNGLYKDDESLLKFMNAFKKQCHHYNTMKEIAKMEQL